MSTDFTSAALSINFLSVMVPSEQSHLLKMDTGLWTVLLTGHSRLAGDCSHIDWVLSKEIISILFVCKWENFCLEVAASFIIPGWRLISQRPSFLGESYWGRFFRFVSIRQPFIFSSEKTLKLPHIWMWGRWLTCYMISASKGKYCGFPRTVPWMRWKRFAFLYMELE